MTNLALAACFFLGIHLLVAGTRLRDAITGAMGERAFRGLFSLASLAGLIWLIHAYNLAQAAGGEADPRLYELGVGVKHLGIPLVALAFLLGVQGLLAPNPASARGSAGMRPVDTVKGVIRITRHPFLWGVVLWSAFHLAGNSDLASVLFFGTFFLLALLGTFSIDAKRRRKMGAEWDAFAAATSNLPFAAVAAGRVALKIRESLGWRFWVAAALFIAFLFGHRWIIGISPFP